MTVEPDSRPFGRKLVDAVHEARVRSRRTELPIEHEALDAFLDQWAEKHERAMAPNTRALYAEMLDLEHLPAGFRQLIEGATNPEHLIDFVANIILTVAGTAANAGAITAPFVQRAVNEAWVRHPDRPLDPEELAVAVVKGWLPYSEAFAKATMTGLSEPDFQTLVDSTGEPPGPMDLLAMWRRDIIDTDRLIQGIQESRLKIDWAADLEKYAYGPPSAPAAILGAVQNHLSDADARRIVQQNGIDPANYDWLYQNAGRPPGPMQMIDAWNRGVGGVDQGVVEQAIRESDVKNKYIPALVGLREHLLPQKTIVAGVHQGVIPDSVAATLLAKIGISATNAGYLIQEGHNTATAHARQLSASQITTAYEDGSLTRDQAQTHLLALGYVAGDAAFLIDLVDVKWQQALHNATVTKIRTLYLGHHLDRATASTDLDTAGVSPAHRDLYLHLWDVVRSTPQRTLTVAEAGSAYKLSLITEADFRARLAAMGYNAADVDLQVLLHPTPTAKAARK